MPVSQEGKSIRSVKISQNPQEPIDLNAIYKKVNEKKSCPMCGQPLDKLHDYKWCGSCGWSPNCPCCHEDESK